MTYSKALQILKGQVFYTYAEKELAIDTAIQALEVMVNRNEGK